MRQHNQVIISIIIISLLALAACGNPQEKTPTGSSTLESTQAPASTDLTTVIEQQEARENTGKEDTMISVQATIQEEEPSAEETQTEQSQEQTPAAEETKETTPSATALTQATVSAPEQASKADFVLAATRVEQKNENKIITVSLIPTAQVASIEFDINLGNYTYDSIDTETAARRATKDVIGTMADIRTLHVNVFGTNDFTIDEGDIVTVYFTGNGSRYLTLSNIQGKDSEGKQLTGK